MADSPHQLRPEVAAQFRATVVPCQIHVQRLGRVIDLRELTLAEAQALVQDPQFPYLVPHPPPRRAARRKAGS